MPVFAETFPSPSRSTVSRTDVSFVFRSISALRWPLILSLHSVGAVRGA